MIGHPMRAGEAGVRGSFGSISSGSRTSPAPRFIVRGASVLVAEDTIRGGTKTNVGVDMAKGKRQDAQDTELKEEIIRSTWMQTMNLIAPNLNLNLNDIAMNTGVLTELMKVLEQKGIISAEERERIYLEAKQAVSSIKEAHFRRLGVIDKRKREALEEILDSE